MLNIKNVMKEFIEDESGLTAVEYAIAGSLVVGGMVVEGDEEARQVALVTIHGGAAAATGNFMQYFVDILGCDLGDQAAFEAFAPITDTIFC